jgi:hypothetical protein
MGHVSCKADVDVWLKPEARPNGFQRCSPALCFVDDVLVMRHNAMTRAKQIKERHQQAISAESGINA